MTEDLDRARETVAHQIAAGVHQMLAERRVTVSELKDALASLPQVSGSESPDLLDELLAAKSSDRITCIFLADIALAMGFEWEFSTRRLEAVPEGDE